MIVSDCDSISDAFATHNYSGSVQVRADTMLTPC